MNSTLATYIFKQTCINRYFELEAAKAHQQGFINIPMYLSVGQEHIAATVSKYYKNYPLFPQHRCHSWYLSWGIPPEGVAKELLSQKDGYNQGKGGSSSISSKEFNIFAHSGLLGDQIPIATGYAQASKEKTICILGDASAEEDYALASFGYAATHKLPILYICEDNNLSILTEKKVRRSWDLYEVALGFGLNACNINDEIDSIIYAITNIKLPGLININTCRHLWHAGSGCDGLPKYNRFEEITEKFRQYINVNSILKQTKTEMFQLWQRLLKQ